MVAGFAALLFCQLAGEATVRGLGLPLPGPVIGMIYLVVGIALWERIGGRPDAVAPESPIGRVADGLLASLGVLFVPAGVGVVQYLGLIGANGPAIGAALILSTLVTLVATVGTFRLVRRLVGPADEEGEA